MLCLIDQALFQKCYEKYPKRCKRNENIIFVITMIIEQTMHNFSYNHTRNSHFANCELQWVKQWFNSTWK